LPLAQRSRRARAFLLSLRDIGRAAADLWLETNVDAIEAAQSIDKQKHFL
jgi:hypothetical protein